MRYIILDQISNEYYSGNIDGEHTYSGELNNSMFFDTKESAANYMICNDLTIKGERIPVVESGH